MEEKILNELTKLDIAGYRDNFSAIEALPFGKAALKLLYRLTVKEDALPQFPKDLTVSQKILILTDRYPNQKQLYRNGFVHRRVKLYRGAGVECAVFCMDMLSHPMRYEFDGVTVTVGGRCELYAFLSQNPQIETVCIHFFEQKMWDVLKHFDKRLVIWSHGFDILDWHHRAFLYPTAAEVRFAKAQSASRAAFWREIFTLANEKRIDAQFIFVSDYLRGLANADHGMDAYAHLSTHVIHNCIDTDLFAYTPKVPSQRMKLLSVRSYDSVNYANDLTVKAIELLSKEPFFDKLEFLIAGNGALFDTLTKPLRKFKNVTLHKGFYRQEELAALYGAYGVAILPTRFDTQGVARDEAFSCGMAVITTDCACYREFADESCSMPVKPESAKEIADAIKRLYEDEALFLSISAAAREQAMKLSERETIQKELKLIQYEANDEHKR